MRNIVLILTFFLYPLSGISQSPIPNQDEYYFRLLQVAGLHNDDSSYLIRPGFYLSKTGISHPWQSRFRFTETANSSGMQTSVHFFEPIFFQSYNSTLPRGSHDGAIWQGKGYNNAFSAGLAASLGPLHVQLRPVFGMVQNSDFDLGPYEPPQLRVDGGRVNSSIYAYRDFRGSVDYAQRFGEQSFTWFDIGESSVELRYSGFRAALSNKRIWTGPGIHTSLQFGYHAPGFLHLYLGTYRPIKTVIGSFESAYIFGGMRKSDYFDVANEVNSMQSVNSFIFIYSPWFTDHFSFGLLRTYFHPYPKSFREFKVQAGKLFDPALRSNLSDGDDFSATWDPDNQVGSIFFRFFLPDYGFEIYSEYGRNDHNADWRDFRAHPNHQRAYTIGIIKTLNMTQNRLAAFNIEINQLETNRTSLTRGNQHLGGWYTHGRQIQGFSNKGQILGTAYGPGVNIQLLQGDIYNTRGSMSFKVKRITYHNSRIDQYFENIKESNAGLVEPWQVRNIEFLFGMKVARFFSNGVDISVAIDQSYLMNHHNLKGNDLLNTRFELIIRKHIKGWLR